MNQPNNNLEKNPYLDNLNKTIPDFEKLWRQLTLDIAEPTLNFIQQRLEEHLSLDQLLGLNKISVVVDNNFLFGYVSGFSNNEEADEFSLEKFKNTFVFKFINSNLFEIIAPPKLAEELYSKIEQKIHEEKQAVAKSCAEVLLKSIQLIDAPWVADHLKAKEMIGETDADDVPYLALAFHASSHAIISDDQVYKEQDISPSWSNSETKGLMIRCYSGVVSMFLSGISMASIYGLIKMMAIVFRFILDIIRTLIQAVLAMITSLFSLASKIPPVFIGLLISGLALWAYFNYKNKPISKDDIPDTQEKLNRLIEKAELGLSKFSNSLNDWYDLFKPLAIGGVQILAYLATEFVLMQDELKQIELKKAQILNTP